MMLNITIACDMVMLDTSFTPAQRILALKFLKKGMDLRNLKFVRFFQIHALDTFHQVALFSCEKSDQELGKYYFSEFPGKFTKYTQKNNILFKDSETQKNGIDFVTMVLECIVNWSIWYQGDFKRHYEDLLKNNVKFPTTWKYFMDFPALR